MMADDVDPSGETLDEILIFGNPSTRRQFLKRTAAASAAVVIGPTLLGLPSIASGAETKDGLASAAITHVNFKINGKPYSLDVDPRTTLLDLLRENLHLTGSKKGCDHGQCGACTVLLNGRRVNSCLLLAISLDGEEITTIEGLTNGDQLHPVQAAFIEHDGFQCGYCTPGQICSAVACIQEGHANSDDEIREWMSGNLCRCGAYPNIIAAIKEAKNGKSA